MFVESDFDVKILRRCGLYLFLLIQQPSSFHLIYYFPNNLHNSNFHAFSKSGKNTLSFILKHLSSNHNEFTVFATRYQPLCFLCRIEPLHSELRAFLCRKTCFFYVFADRNTALSHQWKDLCSRSYSEKIRLSKLYSTIWNSIGVSSLH